MNKHFENFLGFCLFLTILLLPNFQSNKWEKSNSSYASGGHLVNPSPPIEPLPSVIIPELPSREIHISNNADIIRAQLRQQQLCILQAFYMQGDADQKYGHATAQSAFYGDTLEIREEKERAIKERNAAQRLRIRCIQMVHPPRQP